MFTTGDAAMRLLLVPHELGQRHAQELCRPCLSDEVLGQRPPPRRTARPGPAPSPAPPSAALRAKPCGTETRPRPVAGYCGATGTPLSRPVRAPAEWGHRNRARPVHAHTSIWPSRSRRPGRQRAHVHPGPVPGNLQPLSNHVMPPAVHKLRMIIASVNRRQPRLRSPCRSGWRKWRSDGRGARFIQVNRVTWDSLWGEGCWASRHCLSATSRGLPGGMSSPNPVPPAPRWDRQCWSESRRRC
jgi:hypothetical protein